MSEPIFFKDWLPDQPDFNNPGLTEAKNVLPVGGTSSGYRSYAPLLTGGVTIGSTGGAGSLGLVASLAGPGEQSEELYIATPGGKLYESSYTFGAVSWTDVSPATGLALKTITSLVQFESYVFATDNSTVPVYQSAGGASAFATLGSSVGNAPACGVLGSIGQFLFAGNLTGQASQVQWSSADAPLSWPTPGSTTAIAQQAGTQVLHQELGAVTGIYGGDQWGVILQQGGITRVTYVGGDTVFQFDTIEKGFGMDYPNAAIRIGSLVYFLSSKGFFATDGTQVIPIGEDKVNRWFISNYDYSTFVNTRCAVDWTNKLIYWCFPRTGDSGKPSGLIAYNFIEQRFSHCVDTNIAALCPGGDRGFPTIGLVGLGTDGRVGNMSGTPGTATFTTGESEPNPGGYSYVGGIKPLIDATAGAITGGIQYRNDLQASATTANGITQNSRSGYCDLRQTARYIRAEISVTGTFNAAQGFELLATPAGMV